MVCGDLLFHHHRRAVFRFTVCRTPVLLRGTVHSRPCLAVVRGYRVRSDNHSFNLLKYTNMEGKKFKHKFLSSLTCEVVAETRKGAGTAGCGQRLAHSQRFTGQRSGLSRGILRREQFHPCLPPGNRMHAPALPRARAIIAYFTYYCATASHQLCGTR